MIQNNQKIIKWTIALIALITAFLLGKWYTEFSYTDTCLDMGGGINPGNHSICVIEIEKK